MTLNKDSIAVVTGAGSGIGRALSLRLAAEGIRGLTISDVQSDGLYVTAALLDDSETKTVPVLADVSRLEDIEKLRDETIAGHGGVTHLFNNAGVGLVGRTEEISFEDIEWLMGVNFWGTVYSTKVFLPVFRQKGFGHIINISSVFGLIAPPGQSAYCASKFAVRGFTESLRHELEGTDITVSCVYPGGIKTNIVKDARIASAVSQEYSQMATDVFRKMAQTDPERAADIIVDGVKKKSPRILIGSDANQISIIQRLFPKRYFGIMDRLSGGLLSRFR